MDSLEYVLCSQSICDIIPNLYLLSYLGIVILMDTTYGSRVICRIKNWSNAFSCEVQALIRRISFAGYDVLAINDQITGALPSDTVKNPKLNVNHTSSVLSACSYPMEDSQCLSRIHNSVNAIKTCSKQTNNFQKDQPIVKTLAVNETGTLKIKGPKQTLEDELKDLHLNLLVLEVLAYAAMYNAILDKFVENLELGKKGSAFIQGEMPKKMKDPKLFSLPYRLGDSKPFDTLADLGSCVNLIPLYLFKRLKIVLLEETDHVFGLADGTKSFPVGIFKNVEVHIGRLKLLEDFYVIDMEEDLRTPLLVGRGFLATASAVIDCKKAKIAIEEGVTRSIFGVKEINLGDKEVPHWTMFDTNKNDTKL
ncbi:RNA-directed DNA polymerase, eukaryota, reverse transcriptase zinc-binding domain protein [Tanacetum coccineum]